MTGGKGRGIDGAEREEGRGGKTSWWQAACRLQCSTGVHRHIWGDLRGHRTACTPATGLPAPTALLACLPAIPHPPQPALRSCPSSSTTDHLQQQQQQQQPPSSSPRASTLLCVCAGCPSIKGDTKRGGEERWGVRGAQDLEEEVAEQETEGKGDHEEI